MADQNPNLRIGIDPTDAKRGAREAGAAFDQVTRSAKKTGQTTEDTQRAIDATGAAAKRLRLALFALGGALGLRELTRYADSWRLIEGRLRIVAVATSDVAVLQRELFDIAQRTRTEFEATAELYARVARNAETLGRSQRELLDFTEAVQMAIQVSGATAQEASAGVIQLSQALASGRLSGDEFRSVSEQMPGVLFAIQQATGKTAGELRKMAHAQELTADIVVSSILAQKKAIEEDFADVPVTISQSFTVLKNEIIRFIGAADNAKGVSSAVASVVMGLAGNLTTVVAALGAAAAAWVAYNVAIRAAAAWNAIVASAQTIAAFVSLARTIRSVADAMALFSMLGKGAVGVVAAVVAAGAGFVAFKKLLSEIAEETERFNAQLSDGAKGPGAALVPDEDALNRLRKLRQANEDMLRVAEQNAHLAGMQGAAQERARVNYEAQNKVLEAQRELKGDILKETLHAIEIERQWNIEAVRVAEALEKQKSEAAAMQRVFENLTRSVQEAFATAFERMLTGARDVFGEIRRLFFRLVAEMVAAKATQRLAAVFAGVLGGASAAAAQVVPITPPDAMPIPGVHPIYRLPGVVNDPTGPSFMSQAGAYGAVGLSGAAVGYASSSPFAGAAGGALSGAALGSVLPGIGTAVGAVVGGVTGLVGGLFGQARRSREAAKQMEAARKQWRRAIDEFVADASFAGNALETEARNWQRQVRDLAEPLLKSFLDPDKIEATARSLQGVFGKATADAYRRLWAEALDAFGAVMDPNSSPDAFVSALEAMEAQIRAVDPASADAIRVLIDSFLAGIERMKEALREEQRMAIEDLEVRNLRARGLTDEADALALVRQQERERAEWLARGYDAATIAALEHTHEMERQAQAAKDTADAIRSVTSALNAPTGLRLSLERWRATAPSMGTGDPSGGPRPIDGPMWNGRSGGISITGPVTVQVTSTGGESDVELARKIQRGLGKIGQQGWTNVNDRVVVR